MSNYQSAIQAYGSSSSYLPFMRSSYLGQGNYSRGGNAYLGSNATMDYIAQKSENPTITASATREYHFAPADFLSGIPTRLVNANEDLLPLVEQAFEKTTNQQFPDGILFNVVSEEVLAKTFGPGYTPSLQGFCLNRNGFGTSEIFVKQGELAQVMLTLGHEIGHALTPALADARDEEAKAFAFSLAWMEKIKEHNIGNIAVAIHPEPAHNGLHNVAFNFVMTLGTNFLETFRDVAKGITSINNRLETILR